MALFNPGTIPPSIYDPFNPYTGPQSSPVLPAVPTGGSAAHAANAASMPWANALGSIPHGWAFSPPIVTFNLPLLGFLFEPAIKLPPQLDIIKAFNDKNYLAILNMYTDFSNLKDKEDWETVSKKLKTLDVWKDKVETIYYWLHLTRPYKDHIFYRDELSWRFRQYTSQYLSGTELELFLSHIE